MTADLGEDLDHLALLRVLQDAFLATVQDVDPATPVPSCGRWRVRDLVVHLARVHHWAAAQARRTREVPLGRGPFVLDALYAACAAELRETLAALGPHAPARTLLGPGPASFWHRRQAHETLVHLWDLRAACGLLDAGRTLSGVDPVVWADTVEEVVTVMQPRQAALGRMAPLPAPVRLAATDIDRTWLLGGTGSPAVTVEAPADDLALLLWGRRTAADVTVQGDEAALADALSRRLTP